MKIIASQFQERQDQWLKMSPKYWWMEISYVEPFTIWFKLVGMTEDGNIRVKDSYCDSKEVSETYFQLSHKTTCVLKSFAATFVQLPFVRIVTVTTNR